MTIHVPDANPGRCLNYRWFPAGAPYDVIRTAVRCNDYEGTEHVCSFTPPPAPVTIASSMQSSYAQTVKKPEPWVKPT